MMNQPSDFTLRGYFEAIRRQKLLILVVVIICGAIGAVIAIAKKAEYSAVASLSVSDPSASLVAGGDNISSSTPLQLSSAAAPQVTRAEVVDEVHRQVVGAGPAAVTSTAALRNRVSVTIDPNSFLVNIVATGTTAAFAEQVANAFATVDVSLSNAESRAGFARQATAVRKQLKRMSPTSAQAVTTASTLARLENLASVAAPLAVSAQATTASGPSTLKRVKTTAAAVLLGLLLGIALATARDALDRRIRRPEEVTAILDHPVIGSVRHEAMGHAGLSKGEGKKALGPLDDRDMESFRILRQNLNFLTPGGTGKTIIVTSPMSQEGKSTVAAGLAASAAESGKRTLLVECDLRRPVMATRHGLRPTPGLTDFLAAGALPQDIVQTVPSTRSSLNGAAAPATVDSSDQLVCITAGNAVASPADLLASDAFRDFLTSVSEVYDLVILDTPPLLAVADSLELIPLVSTVLMCVRIRQTTRDQVAAAQAALDRLPGRPTGLVLTDVRSSGTGSYYGYGYGYGYPAKS